MSVKARLCEQDGCPAHLEITMPLVFSTLMVRSNAKMSSESWLNLTLMFSTQLSMPCGVQGLPYQDALLRDRLPAITLAELSLPF